MPDKPIGEASKIYPLILAGGEGRRLYPLSRPDYPKPFLTFGGSDSLLGQTLVRVADRRFYAPIILGNQRHRALFDKTLPHISKSHILLEPASRNTAASIITGVLHILAQAGDGLVLVLPSDHRMRDVARFYEALDHSAAFLSSQDQLVVFGALPDCASEDYGYIERGERISSYLYKVKRFTEKPNRQKAQTYFDQGSFLWNMGIFFFRASLMRSLFARLAPDILAIADQALTQARREDFIELSAAFAQMPSLSFDYAIMEKIDCAIVMPLAIGWRDLGSFRALAQEAL